MVDDRQQYQVIFDTMTQGVFCHLADGSLVDVNPAALELLGLDRDQFLGRTSSHPEWRQAAGPAPSSVVHPDRPRLLPG